MAKLTNGDRATINRRKLGGYLLSPTHQLGSSKAEFLGRLGFTQDRPELLENELKRIAAGGEVITSEDTGFGAKYMVEGLLQGPAAAASVRVIWVVDAGSELPRLVTAYPAE